MLPDSYDKVPEETKLTVQLFMAHARHLVKGRGLSDDATSFHMDEYQEEALVHAVDMAVEGWRDDRKPCSAEQFVQWFATLVWRAASGSKVRPKPCAFLAPVVGGPLSTEFLEAIGNTEAEVREIIKEESTEEDAKLALRTVPAFVKTETSPPGIPSAPAAHTNRRAQQVKGEPMSPVNTPVLGKRKNDKPETTTPKYGRGNDGKRVPPGSRDTNRTQEQWGAPLSAKDHQVMNIGLMTDIWTNRISPRHMSDYGGGLFEVRFPSDKAWALLGKDIRSVFKLISSEWRPIRLHTRASGAFMCVGLWVRTGQTQGQKAEVMRHTLPELYRLLRRWSLQAQGSGQAESLADFLTDYLGA